MEVDTTTSEPSSNPPKKKFQHDIDKKKSHRARSGEYGGEEKQLLFLSSKTL